MSEQSTPELDLKRIVESAHRLGIELDEGEALQWMTALAAAKADHDVVMDSDLGVFGHKVTMLDFSPADLAYFREVGRLVEFHDRPGVVETALALSGSAAQSKIQTYPGDCDYFERVNIIAPTREAACNVLADIVREKALNTAQGPTYRLMEVKFGSYPFDAVRDGKPYKAGAPVNWTVPEIRAGRISLQTADGIDAVLEWGEAAQDPGWIKLDWVVADPVRGQVANASNMLDITWEDPDGNIVPLDGYLDPYFQEVYLEAESIPLFSKLVKHVSTDALESYIKSLEKEVAKYCHTSLNYGKAAKRMYNIFRLTGRYEDAAFLRELFDEPTTLFYQVGSLIRTIDEAAEPESTIEIDTVLRQCDQLILTVVDALEGDTETEIVRNLLRLRESVARQEGSHLRAEQVAAARGEVINLVNNFFYEKLTAMPTIKEYIDSFKSA